MRATIRLLEGRWVLELDARIVDELGVRDGDELAVNRVAGRWLLETRDAEFERVTHEILERHAELFKKLRDS